MQYVSFTIILHLKAQLIVALVMHCMLSIEKYVNISLQFDSRLSRHDFVIFLYNR